MPNLQPFFRKSAAARAIQATKYQWCLWLEDARPLIAKSFLINIRQKPTKGIYTKQRMYAR